MKKEGALLWGRWKQLSLLLGFVLLFSRSLFLWQVLSRFFSNMIRKSNNTFSKCGQVQLPGSELKSRFKRNNTTIFVLSSGLFHNRGTFSNIKIDGWCEKGEGLTLNLDCWERLFFSRFQDYYGKIYL